MADTPISGFSNGAPLLDTDELVIARSGTNRKFTYTNLKTQLQNELTIAVTGGDHLSPEQFNNGFSTGTGALQLLSSLGVSQAEAEAYWTLTTARWGSINPATTSLDDVAMQEALLTKEQSNGDAEIYCHDNRVYYYNRGHYLARTNARSAANRKYIFKIYGGTHINASGAPMVMFDRMPATQAIAETDANNYISYQYIFENMTFRGFDGTKGDGDIAIRLGASYLPQINNCHVYTFDEGVQMFFCLHGKIFNCNISDNLGIGVLFATGVGKDGTPLWTNATINNSASNGCSVHGGGKMRVANGAFAGVASYGNDGITIMGDAHTVFEGAGTPDHHIFIDGQGSSTVNSCVISNLHIEQEVAKSWIKIKAHSQGINAYIDKMSPNIVNASNLAFIEAETSDVDNSPGSNGSIEIVASFLQSRAYDFIMRRSGFGFTWFDFDKVKLANQTAGNLDNASNWDTSVISGITGDIPADSFLTVSRVAH